jgi:ribosomal protein S3
MKTILTLGVGFWLGRQIYVNYDKRTALKKEAQIKARLQKFLEDNDFSKTEIKKQSNRIIG